MMIYMNYNVQKQNCDNSSATFFEFCDDIFITGTPDDMIFKGQQTKIEV